MTETPETTEPKTTAAKRTAAKPQKKMQRIVHYDKGGKSTLCGARHASAAYTKKWDDVTCEHCIAARPSSE